MIDRLRRIALAVQYLRLPSIILGGVCLISVIVLLLTSQSRAEDRWLMPSLVGLLWALSVFSFIETFRGVPAMPDASQGIYDRLVLRLKRAGYWIMGAVFLAAMIVAIAFTTRLLSIWLSEYAA